MVLSPRISGQAVGVLGAGSWGTALAVHLNRVGHDVRLWARDPGLVSEIRRSGSNERYLPDVRLPPAIAVTNDVDEAVSEAAYVVLAGRLALQER